MKNVVSEWLFTPPACGEKRQDLGGKARALVELSEAGFLVPEFLVLTPAAFAASIGNEGMLTLQSARSYADAAVVLEKLEVCPAIREALLVAVKELCHKGRSVAVRSSALDEDGAAHSFAGQLESFLFVDPDDVVDKVLTVWKSAFAPRVWAYRRERGLEVLPHAPAVIIQRMVSADAAGVAFSADPVSARRGIAVVGAVRGVGAALVSGESNADTFHVDRDGTIIVRDVRSANHASERNLDLAGSSGAEPGTLGPAIDDAVVRAVARLARDCERHFGRPQDIEWAVEGDQLWLLQSRPITTLAKQPDPDGALCIWDNSNIAESYGGVTTPLTFSFVRRVYEEVYRQFCGFMRVPESRVEAADSVFAGMLGLIRGRVYYNLLNWHRVLAMLPGYQINRSFMEQMMGVKESLPAGALSLPERVGFWDKCRDLLSLVRTGIGLMENHLTLPRQIARFRIRLETALATSAPKLEMLRPDELVTHYRDLERQLLRRWDAPLVNDFFAMIFYGVLRKLCEQWCGRPDGTGANELIRNDGGIISAEPAQRLRQLASSVQHDPELVQLLRRGSVTTIRARVKTLPQLQAQVDEYLEKFGDRCLDELKLESETLHDNPTLLYRSIGNLAAASQRPHLDTQNHTAVSDRQRAEESVIAALRGSRIRAALFRWVLRHARARVRDRENLRFERTRLFGRVRRIFVELGRGFHSMGLLEDARDVFYLEVNEVLGAADGTATTTDLAGLIAVRKAEFQRYRQSPAPADRFTTYGPVVEASDAVLSGVPVGLTEDRTNSESSEEHKGLGCSPGVVRGRVRVVADPRNAELQPGEILVAERTDPGWVMLFPMATGLLVERGSLLSHSAIVSRELGLPAIVSIPNVTRWLRSGDEVLMDGTTGLIRRLTPVDL